MKKLLVILCVFVAGAGLAQRVDTDNEQLLTAGFQLRPVFASRFLGAGEQTGTDRVFTAKIKPALGYTFGMIIRRGFTRKISIETGINYFRRNYTMTCTDDTLGLHDVSSFGLVTYEIPVQLLIYVRLGKQFYMNGSTGISLNWFASDVASLGNNQRVSQRSYLNRTIGNPALLANVGFEYRTEKAGIFYLGGSLHLPWTRIATSVVKYDLDAKKYNVNIGLTGAFLTGDIRYFFHAKPVKKKMQGNKKKKK